MKVSVIDVIVYSKRLGSDVTVAGFVPKGCDGLAVTPSIDADDEAAWRVTHVRSGLALPGPAYGDFGDAAGLARRLAALTDWTRDGAFIALLPGMKAKCLAEVDQ